MSAFDNVKAKLNTHSKTWLVTGAAGFIGSNLLEALLQLNQRVIGLDDYSTGSRKNLEEVQGAVSPAQWKNFTHHEGDIRDLTTCLNAAQGADIILHQAALGSVPRSIEEPIESHHSNVTGFVNILLAGRQHKISRIVYASSSAVYGDEPSLPKTEENIGKCLSPYAATKLADEIYADAFARCYGLELIGLRYFNVFGPRQDPNGPYAAVIPKWIDSMIRNETIFINGDGQTSRDFCYIANIVQANLLAATTSEPGALNQAYNIAIQSRTALNELFERLRSSLLPFYPHLANTRPVYREFRPGDVRHSEADILKAMRLLGYAPTHNLVQGLAEALPWYRSHLPA
jgi:UDP-N-acetylglucosamine 4-epimerase